MLNSAQLAVKAARRALEDFEYFCKRCFYIRTKDGLVKPLIWNKEQRLLIDRISKQQRAGKPVRIVVLKARQVGISTIIEAYILWRLLRDGNINALELADDTDSAEYIFGISRFAVKSMPQWFRAVCAINEEYFTKRRVVFEHNNSSLSISSADSNLPGRSRTLHLLHLSEAAYFENTDQLLKDLFAAVPKTPNTAVFVESTGVVPAGFFYDLYTRAKNGKNDYEAVFFPWFIHDEYRMPVPDGVEVRVPESLEHLQLDAEQLYWRQWVIENDYNGDESKFTQEFPATEEEAWLREAANIFNPAMLYSRMREVEALDYLEGYLVRRVIEGPVEFVSSTGEGLRIFKKPVPGRTYVIGADVGSGVVVGGDGDCSSADVLDIATGEQVAHYHSVLEPGQFAQVLMLLGRFYNNALVAVEITGGHGLAVVNDMRDGGYTMLYRRKVYDRLNRQWVDKLGWNTTDATKKLMIDGLRTDLRNGQIIVNNKPSLEEMRTFIKLPNGKMGAVAGAKDDRVISLAIADQVRREFSFMSTPMQQRQEGSFVQGSAEQSPDPGKVNPWRKRRNNVAVHPELGAYY